MENSEQQIGRFVQVFKPYVKEKIIPWVGGDAVGLSILREYPDNIKFIPAKNGNGEKDSVALIKIGYLSVDHKSKNANLYITISKASRFLLNGHFDFIFNKENKESPTEDSLKESKASKQPIDLSDDLKYQFNIETGKIRNLEKNKLVDPSDVVDEIYQLHLKTLSSFALFFRFKMLFQKKVVDWIGPINESIKALNLFLFGKTIRKTDDLSLGIFKTYPYKDLITLSDEKIKILGSDFPVSSNTARTFAVSMLSLFLAHYYFGLDFLGLVKLSNASAKNFLFSATYVGVLLVFFDIFLPFVLFAAMNLLIVFNLAIMRWRIKF